ncbi:coiled-coil domain-containing protein 171-like [Solea solea]|uniref:coiled-coil domain-containing protein 171-like n=1 Tax=Solea solea TaxID=90069 RepID=UPI00272A7817|nr:coiled-coil domain-containing protein 171-like [Solea solea]
MQTEPAERRRHSSRGRRGESGHSRAERRGKQPMTAVTSVRSSEEETTRFKEIFSVVKQKHEGEGGETEEDEEKGRGRSGGDARRHRRGRRAGSEVRERSDETEERLRWRLNQVEKNRLELTSTHNQEMCRLQAELTRLRSSVERGEAQRAELQYQLTASQRVADRAVELSRDRHTLTERAAQLQQKVQELQKVLDVTRQARDEDQHALQQEVEERDKLIQSLDSENQQLQRILQEQEEALESSERRMREVQREREKEAEVKRRQEDELEHLSEREKRSRREKEVSDQRVRSLESSVEAERAAHLESKFNSEIVQLRVRDLEAALAVERSGQQEAQCTLELLRAQFREVERAYSLERERSNDTERTLERLQAEYGQCKSDLSVALETERKTNSDLSEKLEEERKGHIDTHALLEQAAKTQCDTVELHECFVQQVRETLQHHSITGHGSPAVHDGKPSSVEVLQQLTMTLVSSQRCLDETEKQIQDQLSASARLQEENQTLHQLTSDQRGHIQRCQEAAVRLEDEMSRLRQESCDWSTQSRSLRGELQKEREERTREVQKMNEDFQEETKARLSVLHGLYQRLLTGGSVLLTQPHSILGNFTWKELCDVIGEHVDRLTSDLQRAQDKITDLRAACEKKGACVRELQRHQQRALSRLEDGVRSREDAWSEQQQQLQSELQVCRSQCDSLRDNISSLERHRSSLTSDLSRLRGLVSRSRRESSSLLSACALLAGALKYAQLRLQTLCEQKTVLCRRLAEREELEEEVRTLVDALGGEDEEEERGKRAARRWRRSVCAVLAVRRWRSLAKNSTVMFRLEGGGSGLAVCVCGDTTTATQKGQNYGGDEGREVVCARWLRSKRLSSTIVSSMADLQGALAHTGSAPPDVTSAARLGLSRLLDHFLNQSHMSSGEAGGVTLSQRLRLTPSRPNMKALVSTLQQHFLLFSQRLHSAEVERRSLRLEASNLRRGLRQEKDEPGRTVPAERFQRVCSELREALNREQEAQTLIGEQTERLRALQLHADEQTDARRALTHATQALSEARQEVSRKERSLRILGKHLLAVQRERKQREKRTQVTGVVPPPPARLSEEGEESNQPVSLITGSSHPNPAPSTTPSGKTKDVKNVKKQKKKESRGHVKICGRG